jgi:hypothetical protein
MPEQPLTRLCCSLAAALQLHQAVSILLKDALDRAISKGCQANSGLPIKTYHRLELKKRCFIRVFYNKKQGKKRIVMECQ